MTGEVFDLSMDLDTKDAEQSAEKLQKRIKEIFESREGESSKALASVELQLKRNYQAAEELKTAMDELTTQSNTYQEWQRQLADVNAEYKSIQQEILKLADEDTPEAIAKIQQLESVSAKLEHTMIDITDSMESLESGTLVSKEFRVLQDEQEKMIERQAEIREKMSAMEEKGITSKTRGTYEALEQELDTLDSKLSAVADKMQQMRIAGTSMVPPEATTQFQNMEVGLDGVNDKIKALLLRYEELQQKGAGGFSEVSKSMMGLNSTVRGLSRLIPGIQSKYVMGITMAVRGVTRLASLTKTQLIGAVTALKGVVVKLFTLVMSHPIIAVLTAVVALTVVIINKIKKLKEEVGEFVDSLLDTLPKIASKIGKITLDTTKKLLAYTAQIEVTMLRLVTRTITKLIGKIKSLSGTIVDGLKTLAIADSKTQLALGNIIASIDYVKQSFAGVFAPILQTVQPVLTRILDMTAELFNIVGMLIAKATGAKTYKRITKGVNDVNKAVSGLTQSLSGLDNLNTISTNSFGFADVLTEDVEIPDWLNNLPKTMADVAKKFGDGLARFSWDSVSEMTSQLSKLFIDSFNSIVSVDGLGTILGQTLGRTLNEVSDMIYTFLSEGGFKKLFIQIGQGLRRFIEESNPRQLGEIFSEIPQALIEGLATVFEGDPELSDDGLTGRSIGNAVLQFVNGAIDNIRWDNLAFDLDTIVAHIVGFFDKILSDKNTVNKLSKTFASFFNLIFHLLGSFADYADDKWEEWGKSLGDGVTTFFEGIDGKKVASTIEKLALGITKMLKATIEKINWEEVKAKISEILSNIDWTKLGGSVTEISQNLRGKLEDIWEELKKSGVIDEITSKIVTAFFDEKNIWKKFVDGIKNTFKKEATEQAVKKAVQLVPSPKTTKQARNSNRAIRATGDFFDNIANFFSGIWEDFTTSPYEKKQKQEAEAQRKATEDAQKKAEEQKKLMQDMANSTDEMSHKTGQLKDSLTDSWKTMSNSMDTTQKDVSKYTESLNKTLSASIINIKDTFDEIQSEMSRIASINSLRFTASGVRIPHLAQGAVIPPNKQFLAMLGDQRNGTNIEAPLDTIKQAFVDVLSNVRGNDNQDIVINIDGREVMRAMVKRNNEYKKQHNGVSALA